METSFDNSDFLNLAKRKYRAIKVVSWRVNLRREASPSGRQALMQISQVYWRQIKKSASDDWRKGRRQMRRRIVRYFPKEIPRN